MISSILIRGKTMHMKNQFGLALLLVGIGIVMLQDPKSGADAGRSRSTWSRTGSTISWPRWARKRLFDAASVGLHYCCASMILRSSAVMA